MNISLTSTGVKIGVTLLFIFITLNVLLFFFLYFKIRGYNSLVSNLEAGKEVKETKEVNMDLFLNQLEKAIPNTMNMFNDIDILNDNKLLDKDKLVDIVGVYKKAYNRDIDNLKNATKAGEFKELIKTYSINKPYFKHIETKTINLICALEKHKEEIKNKTINSDILNRLNEDLYKLMKENLDNKSYIFFKKAFEMKGLDFLIEDILDILRLITNMLSKIEYDKNILHSFKTISGRIYKMLIKLTEQN